ncbi:MAG: hypothetical protein NVS3B20_13300 [Polyangiales bacterium]
MEERSLAYHARVAEILREDPLKIAVARARVTGWLVAGEPHPEYAQAWSAILRDSVDDICAVLVDRSERARALRQVTPFAGALDPRERWKIWRSVRAKLAR